MMAAFENDACGYIPTGGTTVAIAAFLLYRLREVRREARQDTAARPTSHRAPRS